MAKKEMKEKKEKPLDRMTATELRKYALELGEITGVHGMNKEELLRAIKEVKGIVDEGTAALGCPLRAGEGACPYIRRTFQSRTINNLRKERGSWLRKKRKRKKRNPWTG